MEVKENGALPLWFVKILNELKIYPTSFSKYGNFYRRNIERYTPIAHLNHCIDNWQSAISNEILQSY